jgi:hypothetical protein
VRMIRAVGMLATLLGATVAIGFGQQAGASDNHTAARAAAHHKATCNPWCANTFFEGNCQCECGVQCNLEWYAPLEGLAPAPVSGYPTRGLPASGYPTRGLPVSGCTAECGPPVSGYPTRGLPVSGYPTRGLPVTGFSGNEFPVCGACEVPLAPACGVCEVPPAPAAPLAGIPPAPVAGIPPAPVSGQIPTPTPTPTPIPVMPPAPVSGAIMPTPTTSPTPVMRPAPVSGAVMPTPTTSPTPVHAPVVVPTTLPTTGAPIAGDAAIGGGLLVAGLAMCLAGRPKRRRRTA